MQKMTVTTVDIPIGPKSCNHREYHKPYIYSPTEETRIEILELKERVKNKLKQQTKLKFAFSEFGEEKTGFPFLENC